MNIKAFQKEVWSFYKKNRRDLPWRPPHAINPYKIVVSEIMLQQTQVSRVIPKYAEFLQAFPAWEKLAHAPFSKVLKVWQGLGYNRRALALHKISQRIISEYKGKFPRDTETLITFPGIGSNTAGSILAFAYNVPTIFIETNIRTVFLHYFFRNTKKKISDEIITDLIIKTLDRKNPREWYYALMDLGSYIKKTYGNPNIKSSHYRKQSAFKGSNRELRSLILQSIQQRPMTIAQLAKMLKRPSDIITKNLHQMTREGLLQNLKNRFSIRR